MTGMLKNMRTVHLGKWSAGIYSTAKRMRR